MRNARLFLAAIAAFGIIGGIYAFKTTASDFVWVATTTAPTTFCPSQQFGITTALPGSPGAFTIRGATNPSNPCGTILVKAGL
ncbi:hypothetical protein SAMN04488121_102436 [Chitinophaga filiformis]|uniref:Uncharacterized protein n=1 Tax=Chitinophaga filiformis TaxID=104663 RepID=A0A1G7MHU7_CHIFI|nr:hypothetical protein SAMN04488121_102436 [Chitinophaga filiformis]